MLAHGLGEDLVFCDVPEQAVFFDRLPGNTFQEPSAKVSAVSVVAAADTNSVGDHLAGFILPLCDVGHGCSPPVLRSAAKIPALSINLLLYPHCLNYSGQEVLFQCC